MNTVKISELNGYVSFDNDDLLVVVDTDSSETKKMTMENFWSSSLSVLRNMIYPVGSIYISVSSTSPATLFGGTWEQIKDTFLLSAGDVYNAGSTGGEATHTLSIAEMPAHFHNLVHTYIPNGSSTVWGTNTIYSGGDIENTDVEGGSQPHNNMPPYLTVYMWKRVS